MCGREVGQLSLRVNAPEANATISMTRSHQTLLKGREHDVIDSLRERNKSTITYVCTYIHGHMHGYTS